MDNFQEKIELAALAVKEADALFITAGAGMGVDSGLPDFRGNSGFWKEYPPIAKMGKSFSQMANPEWFEKNPKIAWAFYGHRLNLYRKTVPHNGFKKLLELGRQKQYGYFVYTSNVDGQFQKAGFEDAFVEECHGSIHHFQCALPCSSNIWDASNEQIKVDLGIFEAVGQLPKCKKCGSIARPNILMFGDWNWLSQRSNEQGDRLNKWLETILSLKGKLAIIEMGAGHAVPTVRMQSQRTAKALNAKLIRINPRDFDVPHGQIGLPLGAKEGIDSIVKLL